MEMGSSKVRFCGGFLELIIWFIGCGESFKEGPWGGGDGTAGRWRRGKGGGGDGWRGEIC